MNTGNTAHLHMVSQAEQFANGLRHSRTGPAVSYRERFFTKDFFAVLFLLASCCYELPLFGLSGSYRADPRLFDFACLFALLVTAGDLRRTSQGKAEGRWIVRPLVFLLAAAAIATLATVLFMVPRNLARFPIFYLARYVQLVFAVWFVATARLSRRQTLSVLYLFLAAALVPLLVGILQYAGVVSTQRYLEGGEPIPVAEGRLTSVLGHHYAHYSMFSLLVVVICFILWSSGSNRATWHQLLILASVTLGLAGIFMSGSRAGPYGLVLLVMVVALRSPFTQNWTKYFAITGLIVVTSFLLVDKVIAPEATVRFKDSARELLPGTGERPRGRERSTVSERSMVGIRGIAAHLDYHGPIMLVYGTGFYASNLGGEIRKGYGIHSVPFFPLEQMGLPGFVAAIYLFASLLRRAHRFSRQGRSRLDSCAGDAMFAWWVIIVVVGLGGQIFWVYQGFANFCSLQLCMAALLLSPSRHRLVRISLPTADRPEYHRSPPIE